MNNIYKHANGLIFNHGQLISADDQTTYDVTVILLMMPNNSQQPMMIVDWYFGDADEQTTAKYVERWLSDKSAEDIKQLNMLQDITDEQDTLLAAKQL